MTFVLYCAPKMIHNLQLEFQDTNQCLYLDTSGKSLVPNSVSKIGQDVLQNYSKPWNSYSNPNDLEVVRTKFANILNTDSSSISFSPSTAFSMTLAANNIFSLGKLTSSTTILMIDGDMSSAVMPWQNISQISGSRIKFIKRPSLDISWSDLIISSIDETVSVLCLPPVHWCDGSIIDLVKINHFISTFCSENPTFSRPDLVIDATQCIGAMPFDLQAFSPHYPTFLACSIHKWLNCPHGMSLVYLNPAYHDRFQPLDQHDRSRLGAQNPRLWDEAGRNEINTFQPSSRETNREDRDMEGFRGEEIGGVMTDEGYPTPFLPGARRIDSGGRPSPILLPMLSHSLDLIQRTFGGADRIHASLSRFTRLLSDRLSVHSFLSRVYECLPTHNQSGHILGIRIRPDFHTRMSSFCSPLPRLLSLSDIGSRLWTEEKVKISIRHGWIRVSPYLFNHPSEDTALFLRALERVTRLELERVGWTQSTSSSSSFLPSLPLLVRESSLSRELRSVSSFPAQGEMIVVITGAAGWLGQFVYARYLSYLPPHQIYCLYNSSVPEWVENPCNCPCSPSMDSPPLSPPSPSPSPVFPHPHCLQVDLSEENQVQNTLQSILTHHIRSHTTSLYPYPYPSHPSSDSTLSRSDCVMEREKGKENEKEMRYYPRLAVIHLAAMSSPLQCQRDPERARRCNQPSAFLSALSASNLEKIYQESWREHHPEQDNPPPSQCSPPSPPSDVSFPFPFPFPDPVFIFTSTDLVYDGEDDGRGVGENGGEDGGDNEGQVGDRSTDTQDRPENIEELLVPAGLKVTVEGGTLEQVLGQHKKTRTLGRSIHAPLNPLNEYARTKMMFEKEVLATEGGIVLRLSNMIGPPSAPSIPPLFSCRSNVESVPWRPVGEGKFLMWLKGMCEERQYVGVRKDEIRSFVDILDVVDVIENVIHAYFRDGRIFDFSKVFNVGGSSGISRLDLALILCRKLRINKVVIHCDKDENLQEEIDNSRWIIYSENTIQPNTPRDVTMSIAKTMPFLNGISSSTLENAMKI